MKTALLFLNGRYDSRHFQYYQSLCKSAFTVAVDGGYRFFSRSGVEAKLLIGDLDSLRIAKSKLPSQLEIIKFPVAKDETDTELAIRECLKRGFKKIDLVQPSIGDLDHCFGNLMLLEAARQMPGFNSTTRIRLLSHNFEAHVLVDQSLSITGRVGETLSVLPLTDSISYSCQGLKYRANSMLIRRGETIGLRNKIVSARAKLSINGTAAVFLLKSV